MKFELERDEADQATSTAREESVRLSGQVDALQMQTGEPLRTVGPRTESVQDEGSKEA